MSEATSRVTLLHTNDIHSHLEQAARIAGYVRDIRRDRPRDAVLVVDCGDFLDRARAETEGTAGGVNRNLLRLIGYDAVVPGNNEGLTYTFEQLDLYYRDLGIPVVCANFRPLRQETPVPWLQPSTTVVRAGLRIGLIGATAPYQAYYELLGWEAGDPFDAVAREARRLRPEVDILVVLSHLGLRQDERMAAEVPGLDLILGAHTHHLLEKPIYVGHTAIGAAGKFGQYAGHLTLNFGGDNRLGIEGGCVPMDGAALDADAAFVIEAGLREARTAMGRVVAELDAPLPWLPERESPLANLLAAVVRRRTGAEIGLVNAGQFLGSLPAGEVTEAAIHALCPSPINCCTMVLSGAQLLQAMEESLLPAFYDMDIRGFGFRGLKLGTLCFDGIAWESDAGRPPHARVVRATVNGAPLEADRDYLVGTLDMFSFGVGHLVLKEGRDVRYFLPEFIRELLCDALGDRTLIEDARKPRMRRAGQNPPTSSIRE